jgi:tRNA-dihydrouridine synthase
VCLLLVSQVPLIAAPMAGITAAPLRLMYTQVLNLSNRHLSDRHCKMPFGTTPLSNQQYSNRPLSN